MLNRAVRVVTATGFIVSTVSPFAFHASRAAPKGRVATRRLQSTTEGSEQTGTTTSSFETTLSPTSEGNPRRGPSPVLVLEGDTLDTLPKHVGLVVGLWALSGAALAPCIEAATTAAGALGLIQVFAATLLFSDFFSGLFHWASDNYGNKNTPVFGGVIEAFQGHHVNPWTITYRGFFNNVHKIALSAIPLLGVAMLASPDPGWRLFWVVFVNAQMLSQEFHKLSHTIKPPSWAAWLQSKGLIIGRRAHGQHHNSPFEAHYCILTGWCNPALDRSGVWRRAEALVYRLNGQEPNCWKDDPDLKRKALGL